MTFPSHVRLRGLLWLALLAAPLMGCGKTNSSELATDQLYVVARLTGNSTDSVQCSVELRQEQAFGGSLELTGADRLTCGDGTATVVPGKVSNIGTVSYSATLAYSTSSAYQIVFSRSDTEKYTFTMKLPAAVTITGPTLETPVKKKETLTVGWNQSTGTTIDVRVSFEHTDGRTGEVRATALSDTGQHSFVGTALNVPSGPAVPGRAEVTRHQAVAMPEGLKGEARVSQAAASAFQFVDSVAN